MASLLSYWAICSTGHYTAHCQPRHVREKAHYRIRWTYDSCISDLYHVSFSNERWPTKALVYAIYLVETTQTILISHDAFNAYAIHFGDLQNLDAMQNEWLAVPVFSAVGECITLFHAVQQSANSANV